MLNHLLLSTLSGVWLEEVRSSGQVSLQEQPRKIFLAAGFLVSVPVFIQAPLVRMFPWVSLLMTLLWVGIGLSCLRKPEREIWGDLLLGFSWSWLAGSIYWGWFRLEPLIHLPIEAIGVPFALWGLSQGVLRVGNLFYLGSLLGTAITDVYFYITHLIPYWRQVMSVETEQIALVLQTALTEINNPWGISWAIVLANVLLALGLWGLQKPQVAWWAFSGAILSTILVDSLFLVAAFIA